MADFSPLPTFEENPFVKFGRKTQTKQLAIISAIAVEQYDQEESFMNNKFLINDPLFRKRFLAGGRKSEVAKKAHMDEDNLIKTSNELKSIQAVRCALRDKLQLDMEKSVKLIKKACGNWQ